MDRAIPVIVQTAHGGIDTVVGAMRAGAVDFVVKPASAERLQVSIDNALKLGALEGETRAHEARRLRHAHLPRHRHPEPGDGAGHPRSASAPPPRRSRS